MGVASSLAVFENSPRAGVSLQFPGPPAEPALSLLETGVCISEQPLAQNIYKAGPGLQP